MNNEIPNEYFLEAEELFQRLEKNLFNEELLSKPKTEKFQPLIDEIYRDVHTLKGTSQLFKIESLAMISHALEACLEPVRRGQIHLEKNFLAVVQSCVDLMQEIIKRPGDILKIDQELRSRMNLVVTKLMYVISMKSDGEFNLKKNSESPLSSQNLEVSLTKERPIEKKIEKVFDEPIIEQLRTVEREESPKVENVKAKEVSKTKETSNNKEDHVAQEASSIRVSVPLLDKLMNLVGEIVLTRNQVLQYAKFSADTKFINLAQKLNLVTSELQDNVMLTRMQPIGTIFNKFQRTVRDLSQELNKDIELIVEGAETELDKSLIEAVKDPLTHIVRNSCDHGIETREQRKISKKKDSGRITLKSFHEGGQVVIQISDNGKGLDPKFLKEKAVSKGIISSQQAEGMSNQEAQQLIFHAGFSTADKVSTVSGRGVGMDVVKTNIEKVSGQISIDSTVGIGTNIKLKIPLTLAIVPAMIVRVKNEFYTIPQVKLKELIRIEEGDSHHKIEKLQGKQVFRLRGELIPLVSLEEIIYPSEAKSVEKKSVTNIVLLNGEPHGYGLIVDEICDTADIVIKPLSGFLKSSKIFSGATIMGDGLVALILDTVGLAEKAKVTGKSKLDDQQNNEKGGDLDTAKVETTSYLLFQLSAPTAFAIPVVLVNRIEEFKMSSISVTGNESFVKYRDTLLPIISLNKFWKYERENSDTSVQKDSVQVIVVQRKNRLFGIMVDEILDIIDGSTDISAHLKALPGILGAIIKDQSTVITIIDVFAVIDQALGENNDDLKKITMPKLRILLAEDTKFFAKHIIKILKPFGHEITHVEDGLVALNLLKERATDFDLLISDIEMPKMDGYQLAQSVRSIDSLKTFPMIAVTTHFRDTDQEKGKQAGFDNYLEKLRPDELVEEIKNLISIKGRKAIS